MQILWCRITTAIPTVCFTLAMLASVSTRANGGQTTGTVTGTMTVTTPDTATELWPGDPKPHYLMRADQTYTAVTTVAVSGKFDPHGALLGIRRFFQVRTLGTYNLGLMEELNVSSKDRPANSPFNNAHSTVNYGPYEPDQSTLLNTTNLASEIYGVETIELIYWDANNNQTVLNYAKIDIYGPKGSNSVNYNVLAFPGTTNNNAPGAALNTETFLGDPPRVTLTTSPSIYPSGTFSIYIYPGPAQAAPPVPAFKSWTAPSGDNTSFQILTNNNYYIDISKYVTGSGTYTIQATQTSSTNSFGTETFGSPATFTIKPNYNVTSQIGLSK